MRSTVAGPGTNLRTGPATREDFIKSIIRMHKMSADIETATSVLFEFLSAMKAWNNKFATLFQEGGSLAHRDQAEAEVRLSSDD